MLGTISASSGARLFSLILIGLTGALAVSGPTTARERQPQLLIKPASATSAGAVSPAMSVDNLRQSNPSPPVLGTSQLPVPRWVSIKASKVNVRQGPSRDHALLWTYVRAGVPVEVIAEFDNWRRIRDRSGETGWVLQQMVSSKRTVIVQGHDNVPITSAPGAPKDVVAFAAPGLIAQLQSCKAQWCEIEARGYDGFVPRGRLWGVYPAE
ncbi:MAG TPA: hypothetical protein DCL54_17205 [Alphaproteobacteria bacterium]|nr:hypothetical protein [Alphaproteobacteria bacterium]